ncbi:peptide ABC transporter permease [Arthrobacter sp. ZBG10]|uniref:ABC transporter permease n=1 Tax=unclassified Arthrobacter TaxID=235627 RepID=UPI00067FDD1F|nr:MULTISPECIES: ABC transporter permease [unclassified Arthrobacter]KNH22497.1 peptide ABC transporter permease [Arthrobacter sp. ZBG10]KQQ92263.1 peptide ABC transporter permease [Arthrobacter sp. Leaf141]
MIRFIGRRLLQGAFVLWAAYTVSFFILYLLPGDAVSIMASGDEQNAVDPALVARLRSEYGLDRPLPEQYLIALVKALQLDFGISIKNGVSATAAVAEVLPETIKLAAAGFALAVILGSALAIGAAFSRNRWLRQAFAALPPLGIAVPTFWIGLLLLQFFSFRFRLFPAIGNDGVASLVLPALTLAIPTAAVIAQLLSRSLHRTLGEPYIEQIRAKGASDALIHFGHALRNAAIPTLTMLGILVGNLLAGAVVSETVFSRAGIGRLTVTAVNSRDIPVVQTLVVLAAAIFVLTSLLVDLIYPLVDPRINTARRVSV